MTFAAPIPPAARERRFGFDPLLYLVTDPVLGGARPLDQIVAAAVRGGVSIVQLRNKTASGRDLLEQARALKALLEPLRIPLLVNDRVDIAAAAGVGAHIGQSDLPPKAARALLGSDGLLGLSLDHPEQARAADPACLDYVAHGPFAATGTKADAGAAVGAEGLRAVRALTALPLIAIGGIDQTSAVAAIEAGADGIAVVSAIMAAPDPEAASRDLRTRVEASAARSQREAEAVAQ